MAKGKNFEQLGCQVVVVDSGTRESGLEWLHERGYPFPLLIDRDRVFYHQLGLRRFLNLGGDFIVDSTGKLLYAHHCKNQFDRPDIEALVEFLRQQDMK